MVKKFGLRRHATKIQQRNSRDIKPPRRSRAKRPLPRFSRDLRVLTVVSGDALFEIRLIYLNQIEAIKLCIAIR